MSDFGKNKDGFELQDVVSFQGLEIAIEQKAGTYRSWYNSFTGESGHTLMQCDYGYVKGSSGMDGDEVDVFLGSSLGSLNVFVITQMKGPTFTIVDEQKVMLGFDTEEEAKLSYLRHYNDSRFFGGIHYLTIEDFKDKLSSKAGELIKSSLILHTNSARIGPVFFDLAKDTKYMSNKREATDILNQFSKAATEQNAEISKALTASITASWAKQKRQEGQYRSELAAEEPAIGISRRVDNHEPPPVPMRRVNVYPEIWSISPVSIPETKVPYVTGGSLDQTAQEYRKR